MEKVREGRRAPGSVKGERASFIPKEEEGGGEEPKRKRRRSKWMTSANKRIMQLAIWERAVSAQLPNFLKTTDLQLHRKYGIPPRSLRRYSRNDSPYYVSIEQATEGARERLKKVASSLSSSPSIVTAASLGDSFSHFNKFAKARGITPVGGTEWTALSLLADQLVKQKKTRPLDADVMEGPPGPSARSLSHTKRVYASSGEEKLKEAIGEGEGEPRETLLIEESNSQDLFLDVPIVFTQKIGAFWWTC